jgi:hypothetical protein
MPAFRDTEDGGYSWQEWLTENATVVLRGARDFLVGLNKESPFRYSLFVHPRPDLPAVDLIPLLNTIVGES